MTFKPFADEAASQDIAGLTFENHVDRIAIYGQSVITRDQQGLEQALALQAQWNDIVAALKNSDLSVQIENKPIVMVDNPFESN
ncbi:MAG: hypothetical protein KGO49_05065 [Gammaproteobacteria bacterium]|nr:hypothetical protein [Gammaproteobacteria bacterium]